jgi:DNA polymerase-4
VNGGTRWIAHLDLDAFYASVEQRDHPELRGKPVAVGGGSERGVVMTASYEARAFGVHSALPTAWARRRCPDLIVVPPRFSAYQAASQAVRAIFERVTDLVEPLALDEAYLDISQPHGGAHVDAPTPPPPQDAHAAAEIAAALQATIAAEVGLSASAGVANGKFLAKVASGERKPGGLTLIPPEGALAYLAALPIERYFGVGPKSAARLREVGIRSGAELAERSEAELEGLLGKHGRFLYHAVRGEDPRPVVADRARKSIGAERTFRTNLQDANELAPELARICSEVGGRLERLGLAARTITIKFRYRDFATITRSHTTTDPVASTAELWPWVEELALGRQRPPGELRLVGVAVSGLLPRSERIVQGGLFGPVEVPGGLAPRRVNHRRG